MIGLDINTSAANAFYREIRKFSDRTKQSDIAVFYQVKIDETWDPTLVAERVYGNRNEFLVIMAAAGLDRVDKPLTQRLLKLPNEVQLQEIKRRTGFESLPELREDNQPVWV